MNRRNTLAVNAMALLCLALATNAEAQQKSLKDQLVGTWTLVSVDNVTPDGTRRQNFGANPKGILILDAGGRYAQTQVRADRPRFKANNRLQGTPEENKAAVEGSLATFGTWSVDDASKTLILHIEGSTFPNQEGEDSKRSVALGGEELTLVVQAAAAGGKSEAVYRRAK